jgi:hypothetical protein
MSNGFPQPLIQTSPACGKAGNIQPNAVNLGKRVEIGWRGFSPPINTKSLKIGILYERAEATLA